MGVLYLVAVDHTKVSILRAVSILNSNCPLTQDSANNSPESPPVTLGNEVR